MYGSFWCEKKIPYKLINLSSAQFIHAIGNFFEKDQCDKLFDFFPFLSTAGTFIITIIRYKKKTKITHKCSNARTAITREWTGSENRPRGN